MNRGVIVAAIVLSVTAAADPGDPVVRRGYVDGRFGQVHYHSARPSIVSESRTPLVLFHQNPKSAEDFEPLTREMGRDRLTLAFDTPGYGESDRPPHPPIMSDLAGAMADALDGLGFGSQGKGKVDLFGFHTGVLIATELALTRPDLVRRVVLASVPYMSPEEIARRSADMRRDFKLPEDGSHIMNRWRVVVQNRAPGVSIERAARSFLEDVRSLDKFWYASNAMWAFPTAEKLKTLHQPVLLLAAHEALLENTRAAHRDLLPSADMVELPTVKDDVFDTGSAEFAAALRSWLDRP